MSKAAPHPSDAGNIKKKQLVKSRFQHEPTMASEIADCTMKTRYQNLEMFIYELGKAFCFLWCVWTLQCIRQIPSTPDYKILHDMFYDVFEVPQPELFVEDLSFLFDTSARDGPPQNRGTSFLETCDHCF